MPPSKCNPFTRRRGSSQLCIALLAGACLHVSSAAAQEDDDIQAVPHHGLEFYVSEDAFQALYLRPIELGDFGETQVNLGFFLNEERDLIGTMDLLAEFETRPRSPWTFQVGPKAYAALMNVEETDVFSVALGGHVIYSLRTDGSTAVILGAFYAPSILTFGEADNVHDVHLRLETRLRDSVQIFVGYRLFEWDMTIGPANDPLAAQTRKVDDGFQLGVRATF